LDEPKKHPVIMILLAVAAAGTVPFAFAAAPLRKAWGLPLWLWCSLLFTLLLAGRSIGFTVLLLTLFATQYSGNSLSGFPGQTYREGVAYFTGCG
jgi:hypothetical protein